MAEQNKVDEHVAIYPEIDESLGIERYLAKADRDKIDDGDFAGPDRSFPIDTQAHLDAAAKLIGHAADPAAVKAKAIRIAKRKGFKLPDSWQEDGEADGGDKKERSVSQADNLHMYLPINRSDDSNRMVYGQATAEIPDSYGTIFGYYPDAWTKWRGNIREQHDPKKAVGKAIEVNPESAERAIYVGAKVSRGAQDTWDKVVDGVLSGFSASILPDPEFGSDHRKWPRKEYQGKQYPYLPRYSVVELSLVDNPACPGCNIQIVRSDGFSTEQLDTTEEEIRVNNHAEQLDRAGARVSSQTKDSMHKAIGGVLKGAKAMMDTCGCDGCAKASNMIDPDNDGDVDWLGIDDPDGDPTGMDDPTEKRVCEVVERSMVPIYQRQQSFLARLAKTDNGQVELKELLTKVLERLDDNSSLERVQQSIDAVKVEVDKIGNTPLPGGPIRNGVRPPQDKNFPYSPNVPLDNTEEIQRQVVERLHRQGALITQESQMEAAAMMIRPIVGPSRG